MTTRSRTAGPCRARGRPTCSRSISIATSACAIGPASCSSPISGCMAHPRTARRANWFELEVAGVHFFMMDTRFERGLGQSGMAPPLCGSAQLDALTAGSPGLRHARLNSSSAAVCLPRGCRVRGRTCRPVPGRHLAGLRGGARRAGARSCGGGRRQPRLPFWRLPLRRRSLHPVDRSRYRPPLAVAGVVDRLSAALRAIPFCQQPPRRCVGRRVDCRSLCGIVITCPRRRRLPRQDLRACGLCAGHRDARRRPGSSRSSRVHRPFLGRPRELADGDPVRRPAGRRQSRVASPNPARLLVAMCYASV